MLKNKSPLVVLTTFSSHPCLYLHLGIPVMAWSVCVALRLVILFMYGILCLGNAWHFQVSPRNRVTRLCPGLGIAPVPMNTRSCELFFLSDAREWKAEVCTLGSGTWRSIGAVPSLFDRSPAAFLNRAIHWIVYSPGSVSIFSFDLETEKFQPFLGPPAFFRERISGSSNICKNTDYYCLNIGVIEGNLYICVADRFSLTPEVDVWHVGVLDESSGDKDSKCTMVEPQEEAFPGDKHWERR